jgi:hypothetical protein
VVFGVDLCTMLLDNDLGGIMTDAANFLEEHADAHLDPLRSFAVAYSVQQDLDTSLVVEVRDDRGLVAKADFSANDYEAWSQNVEVAGRFRRRGIATALYVFAELFFGKTLYNFWPDKQTDAARALWAQPNRPFGRRPASGA